MKKLLPFLALAALVIIIAVIARGSHQSRMAADSVLPMIDASMDQTDTMKGSEGVMEKSPTDAMEKEAVNKGQMSDIDLSEIKDTKTMDKLEDVMEKADEKAGVMEKPTDAMEKPGSYVNYENTDISTLSGDIVLSFSATWCPTCKRLDSALGNSSADIPSDLTIVKVDYDTYTDLAKQYGVTSQHTLIQVDASGNEITRWHGGTTLASIVKNLK